MNETQKTELKNRLNALNDVSDAFNALHPNTPNYALWLDGLLASDYATANQLVLQMEAKDFELSELEGNKRLKWDFEISKALRDAGINERFLLYALVQAHRGNATFMTDIEPVLAQIDTDHPRP